GLVLIAPIGALQCSSQPQTSECCDDRLNPPSIPETAVMKSKGRGVLDAPVKPGHDGGWSRSYPPP
ncbi:hypothetical protein ABIA85_006316, partial [Bradyrhizobium sp. LA6.10]|uniref:hypothetical protein n=1 Tax=Bradyrhizobium sp. LA6.10 TaxID=3156318 RepID=UPI00339A90E0